MKTLKLEHELAELIKQGKRTATWRLFDDKSISVNDQLEFVDKVDPEDKQTWQQFGTYLVDEVIEKRIKDTDPTDPEGFEEYAAPELIVDRFNRFYGNKVTLETPIKIIRFHHVKQKAAQKIIQNSIVEAKMYADGGSRGNPGPSAGGFAILDMDNNVVKKSGKFLGITTNNQAEYHSLKGGVEAAIEMGIKTLHVYMDSLLVVNQMKGVFKVRNRDLWPIHDAIKQMLPSFKEVTFSHVPRELNKLADSIVNETLDAV